MHELDNSIIAIFHHVTRVWPEKGAHDKVIWFDEAFTSCLV